MSDLEPQGMNVEDGEPTAAAVVVAAEPQQPTESVAQAPQHTPAQEQLDIDPNTVDLRDESRVRALLAELKSVRETTRTLKDKAGKYDEVAQWYQASRPAIDFLAQNPHLMQPQRPTTTAPEPQQTTDPRWVRLAQKLDLYTPDGKPDVDRAKDVMNDFGALAEEKAQAAIRPLQETTVRERAQVAFQRALQLKAPDGRTPNPDLLRNIYENAAAAGNLDFLATEQGASIAAALALGLSAYTQAPEVQPPAQPPVVTEGLGRTNPNRPPASELETRVAHIRGINPQKWTEYTSKFRAGEANTLED